jgi:pimeloyl-ACP methyl ester carboxylesterase
MRPEQAEHAASLKIPLPEVQLSADLLIPVNALGLVVFAHGSGSSRFSPRNHFVASVLNEGCLATILLDLLTEEEEREDQEARTFRFDIELLANRLTAVTDWVLLQRELAELPLGYFGASTGAAAALIAAAERPKAVSAIVSRGGRPDLACNILRKVHSPTLFIVGGDDTTVLDLNRQALAEMPELSRNSLEVIPGATHLFEEPGALERVAELARELFWRHFGCERCGN